MNQYLKDLVPYGGQQTLDHLNYPVYLCVCVRVCVVHGVNAWASQVAQWVNNPPANGGNARPRFNPLVGKIP